MSESTTDQTVIVRRGKGRRKYHRLTDDGEIACRAGDRDGSWRLLSRSEADAWFGACENEKCFGDGAVGCERETWPV